MGTLDGARVETGGAHEAHLAETVELATRLLSASLPRSIELEQIESFRNQGSRATVLRCAVHTGSAARSDEPMRQRGPTALATVILKRFLEEDGAPYVPDDARPYSGRGRMIGEWSGLRFLQSIEGARWFGPTPLAADPALGLVLIEDLGEGDALADLLQRSGVGVAEDATAALFAYAESLGFMHAATHGRRGAYEATRSACGATAPRGWDDASKLHTEILSSLRASAAEIGLPFPAGAENEIVEVAQVLASPGPFDALSVSDTCPDNHRYFPHPAGSRRSSSGGDGGSSTSGGHLRFFDFEFSSFRHALIDAAYVWMPFPTCWCVNRLPDGLPERLEAAYRRALVSGCPEAAEDTPFTRGLAAACVYWLADSFASDVMGLHRTLDEDRQWGISTTRQRHPLRADNTAAVCERYGWFPTIAELARRFAAHLRERWGEAADMPLYPAFRHPSH